MSGRRDLRGGGVGGLGIRGLRVARQPPPPAGRQTPPQTGTPQGWPLQRTVRILRVPTRTGKPGIKGRHFPVREKSGNFEQTGKVRENHTKYWKTHGILDKYCLLFSVIFK